MIKHLLDSMAFVLAVVCTGTTCMIAGMLVATATGNVNLGLSIFLFGTILLLLLMGFMD